MELNFEKGNGLIPVIVQDAITQRVLMLGYMDEEALAVTKESGVVTFYSRSRQRLWTKGEESGNFLTVRQIIEDCDGDTLLIKALPSGPVCHTGKDTCFNEDNDPALMDDINFLAYLEEIVIDRREHPIDGSYTNHLFSRGINKIAQKVGEEAVELVIEAMTENKSLFLGEAADLLYHVLVLLAQKNIRLSEVVEVLKKRHSR
ncbi:MAG: bifunctional phosphoribosyl-AMP cyclohydrolase/phosphoribosyl-ATP diphosphatase HisIE [Sphaerochaetaceae bacterium]